MEYRVLNNGLKMPMVGLGVYNISERETQRVVEDAKVMPVVNQYETHVLIYQGENAICIKTPMLNYGYVITDQKTTNSVNTIIMLLCSCRKMCTFAAKIAQNRLTNMNFVFISPHFPHTYWQFCQWLYQNGVKVLGIADAPYDSLQRELKKSLTEYYRVNSLENYDEVYRAVAYFAFRYGRIDWIESNNEYWLEQDARLRTDFNVTTGLQTDRIRSIKEKSEMKKYYAKGDIPTARQIRAAEGFDAVSGFARQTDYPIIAKPDVGVGASGTYKIEDDEQLQSFYKTESNYRNYVVEEFITGEICSYDAIIDARGNPLFESMTVWPPSIMDIVNLRLDLSYYVDREIPDSLRELGQRTVKAFGIWNRFVHLEFFRLDGDREGLGKKGDFVALEVNMRPAGGYTPDMINFAHSTDVYKIWADMVAFGESRTQQGHQQYCAFASRRDIYHYVHSHEEVLSRYGDRIVMCERMPELFSAAMGQQMYTVKLQTMEEVNDFVKFVHDKKQ